MAKSPTRSLEPQPKETAVLRSDLVQPVQSAYWQTKAFTELTWKPETHPASPREKEKR